MRRARALSTTVDQSNVRAKFNGLIRKHPLRSHVLQVPRQMRHFQTENLL